MDLDVITIGRVSMDMYSRQIGAPFEDVESFDAMIGGSPSNIAIGTARLGARTAVLTAVGPDEIGRFVLANFAREGVTTEFIRTIEGTRTGLAILGVQPPDRFPLTFYRDNPADIHLTIDDVDRLPLQSTRILGLSGTALSRGTCKEATLYAGERARAAPASVVLDLDLRPDQWTDRRGYGTAIRGLLHHVDVAIGTEEEFHAALAPDGAGTDLSAPSPGEPGATPTEPSAADGARLPAVTPATTALPVPVEPSLQTPPVLAHAAPATPWPPAPAYGQPHLPPPATRCARRSPN